MNLVIKMLHLESKVFERLPERRPGEKTYRWHCKCICGNIVDVNGDQLVNRSVRSCGCLQKESREADITGQRFGMLIAVERVGKPNARLTKWRYKCDCGQEIITTMRSVSDGSRKSCGCGRIRLNKEQANNMRAYTHVLEGTSIERLKSKTAKNNTSGVKGVTWHRHIQKWQAYIGFKGNQYCLGYFDKKDDAAAARATAEKELHGEFLKWFDMHQGRCTEE